MLCWVARTTPIRTPTMACLVRLIPATRSPTLSSTRSMTRSVTTRCSARASKPATLCWAARTTPIRTPTMAWLARLIPATRSPTLSSTRSMTRSVTTRCSARASKPATLCWVARTTPIRLPTMACLARLIPATRSTTLSSTRSTTRSVTTHCSARAWRPATPLWAARTTQIRLLTMVWAARTISATK